MPTTIRCAYVMIVAYPSVGHGGGMVGRYGDYDVILTVAAIRSIQLGRKAIIYARFGQIAPILSGIQYGANTRRPILRRDEIY